MSLFDFFKKKPKKKKIEKKVEEKPSEEKIAVKKEEAKPAVKRPKKKISGRAYQVLYSLHVTEKATGLVKENKYVFKVWPRTNKNEIKKAVEGLYGVDVIDVKIINIPRRQRRLGRQRGWRKGYKKAIVKIKKGQKIEILSR